MRVGMEATVVRQSIQLDQGGNQDTDRCCTPCPDSGTAEETGGPSQDQKVTGVVLQCNQDEAKNQQTTTSPEGRVRRSFVIQPHLNPDRLKTAKFLADKAIKMHKIFSIQGPYPVIRGALMARGWVEQRMHRPIRNVHRRHSDEGLASSNDAVDSDEDDDNSDDVDKDQDTDGLYDLMSRMVRNETVYFYWTNRRDAINNNSLQKEQISNHFAKAGIFTTKVGLCVNLRNLHWFDSADPDTFFPRCYRLVAKDEKQAFLEDYRRTACTSLLKFIVEREKGLQGEGTSHNTRAAQDQKRRRRQQPVVLSKMIDSALKVCQEFLESLEHRDIDKSLATTQTLTEEEWAEFIENYYLVVHGGAEIENSECFVAGCKAMLQRMVKVSPQLDIDGLHNIWIIKPGAKSRGRGIKCAKRLDQILKLVSGDVTLIRESKWVVQKYMECPFLIYGTKFDVRQWFLVTDWNPLTVWFYKKCYLRFSTQPYSLDILDSSVHLCNNSIQKHLTPSKQRHQGVPENNMWSDEQFRTFLSSQGREAQWHSVVVPGMKTAVIHALQTTQDLMDSRKNTFELYGADFMLGRDLRPWLIEINASPTMAHSTPVTARLCTAVQEDTVRVVLDRRADRTADTGDFQLIYRQAAVEVPQYVGVNLLVEGFKIKCPVSLPPPKSSNHSAQKRRSPAKEKETATDKAKTLLKMTLKIADNQLKNTSRDVLPPPVPLPPTSNSVVVTPPTPPHTRSSVVVTPPTPPHTRSSVVVTPPTLLLAPPSPPYISYSVVRRPTLLHTSRGVVTPPLRQTSSRVWLPPPVTHTSSSVLQPAPLPHTGRSVVPQPPPLPQTSSRVLPPPPPPPLPHTYSAFLPPPPLPAEQPVSIPIENFTLHLPMTVNNSIRLPTNAQSQAVFFWNRKSEASKVCSEKVPPCSTKKHLSPPLLLEIDVTKKSRQEASSTLSA